MFKGWTKSIKMEVIRLSSVIGENLLTRNSIKSIFDHIRLSKEKEFIISFENVNFISRSCADEYLKQKNDTYKIVIEQNQNINVRRMLKIVSRASTHYFNHDFSRNNKGPIIII